MLSQLAPGFRDQGVTLLPINLDGESFRLPTSSAPRA